MSVRTSKLMMKKGVVPIKVSLVECNVLSTYMEYETFDTSQSAVITHPSQLAGHSHHPPHILLNQSLFISGCRESNSDYKHPMLAYYHYTTPRLCSKMTTHFCLPVDCYVSTNQPRHA